MTLRILGIVSLLSLGPAACGSKSERTLKDTEGREFRAKCSNDGQCELKLVSGSAASAQLGKAVVHRFGNLVAVCDTSDGTPKAASDCRAIGCNADSDCPPAHGLKDGTCINSLCREPSASLTKDDALMLCLAGTGLGATRPDLAALAANCGQPCRVPAVCRQP